MELRAQGDVKIVLKNRPPPSDSSIESSCEIDGHRWVNKKAQSDPGIDLMSRMQDEALKRLHHEATMAEERKKEQKNEQDTDLQNTPPTQKWRHHRSPPSCRTPGSSWAGAQVIEEENEFDDAEHGVARLRPVQAIRASITPGVIVAPTPILTSPTTPTPTAKRPLGAAMGQGLKCDIPSGTTAAVSHRIQVGDGLDREVVSPTWLVLVGTLQSQMRSRGEPVAPSTGEVNTQQLHVTSHGCEGGAAVEGSLSRDPVGSSPRSLSVDNSANRLAVSGESEGTTGTGVPEESTPGDIPEDSNPGPGT